MNILLAYFMGCLISFGIICTLINYGIYKDSDVSTSRLIFYGSLASWITIIIFIFGIFIGFIRALLGENDDD